MAEDAEAPRAEGGAAGRHELESEREGRVTLEAVARAGTVAESSDGGSGCRELIGPPRGELGGAPPPLAARMAWDRSGVEGADCGPMPTAGASAATGPSDEPTAEKTGEQHERRSPSVEPSFASHSLPTPLNPPP